MLTEIVEARPRLISSGTVLSKAHIYFLGSALRFFLMDTFFMTFKVIDRPEPFLTSAVRFVAFKLFFMSCFMFSLMRSATRFSSTDFDNNHTSCQTDTCRANCILDSHI